MKIHGIRACALVPAAIKGFLLPTGLSAQALALSFRLQSWIFIGSCIVCACALIPAAIKDFLLPILDCLRMRSRSDCNHGFLLPTGLSAHALLFRLKSSIFHWLPNYLRMRSRSVENRRSKFSCSRWIKYKLFINMLTWWYNSEYALPDGTILNMLTWRYNSECGSRCISQSEPCDSSPAFLKK